MYIYFMQVCLYLQSTMFGHVEGAEINFSYVHHALIDLANFFALLFGAGKILYSVFIELFQ